GCVKNDDTQNRGMEMSYDEKKQHVAVMRRRYAGMTTKKAIIDVLTPNRNQRALNVSIFPSDIDCVYWRLDQRNTGRYHRCDIEASYLLLIGQAESEIIR
ncbi:MAG: hypothetical protein PF483_11025, partial [Halothiobacillus sp.]|nr:hypothetical protein [Halothiobacillus sp.]